MPDIKLPELGENIEKGDVVRVLVNVGDAIKVDQPVLELETDKATIEVPSSTAGVVTDVRVKPGDKVKVGQVILVLRDGPSRAAAEPSPANAPAPEKAETKPAPASEPPQSRPAAKPAAAVVDI